MGGIINMGAINPLKGYGPGAVSLHTPEIMRDCIRTSYWEAPNRVELYKTALRLADDFKRRGYHFKAALQIIQAHLIEKLALIKPEHLKQVETGVNWAFNKQDHPITCNGALVTDGICFKAITPCRFHEIDTENRALVKKLNPIVTPSEVEKYLEGLHPTEALFCRWAYLELLHIEHERGLLPGNTKEPILIGFRNLAERVGLRNKTACYSKDTALKAIRLLEDNGFIKTIVRGVSGTRRGRPMSNGYIRVLTTPPGNNTHNTHI